MIDVLTTFFFIAAIIVLGFLGDILFNKTKISDIIILMSIGLLAGPIFNIIDTPTTTMFKSITPFFASLALIVLLFEGGLKMNFFKVLKELNKVLGFTLIIFILTVIFTGTIMLLFNFNLLTGLLLGAIIGGTSSAIVIPLVQKTSASTNMKNLLSMESTFTDALCVIIAITLGGIIVSNSFDIRQIAQNLFGAFSIATIFGLVAGIAWLKLLRDFPSVKNFQYVLTIAVLFILYVFVEFAKSNGAIAALVFGLVLGNAREITQMLRLKETELDTGIMLFQNEISFFIRTFFFVYLGIIFELSSVGFWPVLIALVLIAGIILTRLLGAKILSVLDKSVKSEESLLYSVSARGLAAAVLATYPATIGIKLNGIETQIVHIVFLVILFSNIATTAGVFAFEKQQAKESIALQKIEISQKS